MKNPRKILITGASSGIGEALALEYSHKDISLYLSGRDSDRLQIVADKCRARGADVETALIDVQDKEKMHNWITSIDEDNPLDLVIANAGISGGVGGFDKGEPMIQARAIFDINVYGVFNTLEPVLEKMVDRGRGQIALVSSLAGYRGWPTAPAYSASKGAVRYYGEAMRGAVRKTGVQINVVCPGFVTSRMTDANNFKMPMKMSAVKAAGIIKMGLEKNKGRIAFPLPVLAVSWFFSILPDFLAQKILGLFPAKPAL